MREFKTLTGCFRWLNYMNRWQQSQYINCITGYNQKNPLNFNCLHQRTTERLELYNVEVFSKGKKEPNGRYKLEY